MPGRPWSAPLPATCCILVGVDDDFADFVARARPSLVHLARSLGRDDDAEDVVHTALARVMRFWPRLVGEPFPRRYAYAKRAVVNTGWTYRRRYSSRVVLTNDGRPEQPPSPRATDVTAVDNVALRSAFRALPAHQRRILWLRYCVGAGDPEIADRLGCSPVTVRTASRRGLQALRTALAA